VVRKPHKDGLVEGVVGEEVILNTPHSFL
jgi:hypothetical protein